MHANKQMSPFGDVLQIALHPIELLIIEPHLILLVSFIKDIVQNDIIVFSSIERIVSGSKEMPIKMCTGIIVAHLLVVVVVADNRIDGNLDLCYLLLDVGKHFQVIP